MNKLSQFLTALAGAVALFVVAAGVPASAQTPDGETPSEETVCDGEVGKALGLCNAYCEAMDCDSMPPNASEEACSRVQANFEAAAGHDLPCAACQQEPVTCPCSSFSNDDLAAAGLVEKVIADALGTECPREGEPHATCLDDFTCTIVPTTTSTFHGFQIFLNNARVPGDPTFDILVAEWRAGTGRLVGPDFHGCESRLSKGLLQTILFRDIKIISATQPNDHNPFEHAPTGFVAGGEEDLACQALLPSLQDTITAAIGSVLAGSNFAGCTP